MKERIYKRNGGSFRKGLVPWNKGNHGTGRKAEKGVHGFPKRAVLRIAPNGKVRERYAGVAEAARALGVSDRHSVSQACAGKSLCRGWRLVYEEDYVSCVDYSYRPTVGRDFYGRLQPGHRADALMRKPSAETRARLSEKKRELSRRMAADPGSGWGKGSRLKPVVCLDTGERFPSIKAAGERFGLKPNWISGAMRRNGRIHGLKFRRADLVEGT